MNVNNSNVYFVASAGFLRKLVATPVFFLLSPPLLAAMIIDNGATLDIDATTPIIDYLVRNNSVLNMTGATTNSVTVQSGSTLNINGATIAGNPGAQGIMVNNSRAVIDRAVVTSDTIGLAVNRPNSATTGSTVSVSNSQISGGRFGAQVTGLSTLSLVNTQVTATTGNGVGMSILGGDVRASADSRIIGAVNGVVMANDPLRVGANSLALDGSSVEGVSGSAILIQRGISANIEVLNNSVLRAGNNTLVDIQEASTGSVNVGNSLLEGNIQVSGNSTANLTFDQGRMTGDVLVESGSTANVTLNNQSQFTGRLDNVNGVTINSQSNWTLTGNDSIGALAMNGGTVSFGAADATTFYQLNVGALAGNGTFAMKGDFATGDRDFLNVSGVATGDFGLAIRASGVDATSRQQLNVVHTGAGDARFSLVGGPVDLGAFSYELSSITNGAGETDWFLDSTTKTISPGARSVMALFNAAPTVWYGELTSLRSRMGELRFNGGQPGAWARTYGNKYDVAEGSGVGYQQTQQGFSLGADARLGDSQWLIGVLAGYSQSDLDVTRGTSGTIKSYYLGPYITWLDADTGYYFDGVLKFNRFRNDSKVSLSDGTRTKGDYDNMGVGASAEFGRHIKLDDGYFVEPFTQLSAVVIQGRHYDLDNGMEADGDRTRSLLGKLGATAGRNIALSNGNTLQPYVRAAMVHEFAKNNEVQVNNNTFNNDLSGSRAEFGVGVAASLSEKLQLHADFDYGKGEHIEQPWGANVGVRYAW